jgi:hypothetical protein
LSVLAVGFGVGVSVAIALGVGVGVGATWLSFTEIVGDEYVKPLAERLNQPSLSLIVCVAV